MTEILMGTIASFIVVATSMTSFILGVKLANFTNKKPEGKPSDEQKKRIEGIANMLNYANRHRGGGDN